MPISFRRCIALRADRHDDGHDVAHLRVRAALEDDFHHFRVELDIRDGRITAIQAESPRHPYSLCPAAAQALQALQGSAPDRQAHAVHRVVDPSQQCTHLLDLAGLACATAARGLAHRRYDIEVPMRVAGRTRATLARDGVPMLAWEVLDLGITGPAPYAGVSLRHGMAQWALDHLDEDESEAALVLRRCTVISLGKGKPLDLQVHAMPTAACFAQQPERAPMALRQVGSTWDFSDRAAALCADDEAWLRFAA